MPEAATLYAPPLQVDLQPIDLESGIRLTDSRVTWASSVPISVFLGLTSLVDIKSATLRLYIRQNVDIIPVSSFNVITCVVITSEIKIHLRQTPFMYNTDIALFYYCLLSMNSIIILST